MKKYKGAVFFDYDGTLSDETEGIFSPTEKSLEAIKKLKENGYFVCLTTGRGKCYAPFDKADFDGFISSNGAYAEIDGEMVFKEPFAKELVLEAMKYLDENGMYYFIETQEQCYSDHIKSKPFTDMLENFAIDMEFLPCSEANIENIYKIVYIFTKQEQYENLKNDFKGKFDISTHRAYKSGDISVTGISKGTGIKNLIKILDIPYENTYAFGDGDNDIEMFKAVCHPVALKVCHPDLEKCAEYVTDTVKNEGVYKGLQHYGII